MSKYKNYTLHRYLQAVSEKKPTPGGGSVAALTGALGVSLIMMVANYSKGKNGSKGADRKIESIFLRAEKIKKSLLECVDLDAEAYMKVVNASKKSQKEKKKALSAAKKIPKKVCVLCHRAVSITPFLVEKGNIHLLSDIEVALEMLLASYHSALALQSS